MKKICLIVFCMCFVSSLFGQEPIKNQPKQKIKYDFKYYKTKNEIQTNMFLNMLGVANISYERIIDETISINTFLGFGISDGATLKFALYPKIKIYFGDGICHGWYIDSGIILLHYYNSYTDYWNNLEKTVKETGLGIGLGFGYKFINYKNWVFELGLGVLRTSIKENTANGIFGTLIILGGKRF